MEKKQPETLVRQVLEACADCDFCRHLMEDTPCQVFPELYRLHDGEARGEKTTPAELKSLVDLCNFCALCPCFNVRADLMRAKQAFVDRDGLPPTLRLLEDVERLGRVCGAAPRLTNFLIQREFPGRLLKRLAGIHPERKIPSFPGESFPGWTRRQGLHIMRGKSKRKVAYFAGCTAQYLFPEVARAAVEVLQHNGVEVYVPEQKCCGMPTLLEGDGSLTARFVLFNIERLSEAVDAGFEIVCSCPTCGYMLKGVLSQGASPSDKPSQTAEEGGSAAEGMKPNGAELASIKKSYIDGLLKDEGVFASIDARKRLKVARNTHDLGEYLRNLHRSGELKRDFARVQGRTTYYPPCHLREQKIGEPYAELLTLIPGLSLERIEGAFFCCGIAGIMGFKRGFHDTSVEMGRRLMEKIQSTSPGKVLTDCLSCRIQFNQMIPHPVAHPIEILRECYAKGDQPRR